MDQPVERATGEEGGQRERPRQREREESERWRERRVRDRERDGERARAQAGDKMTCQTENAGRMHVSVEGDYTVV